MQKMHRQEVLEQKLKSAIGDNVEHNHHLGCECGNALGKQADHHNCNHGDVVKACENANDLP